MSHQLPLDTLDRDEQLELRQTVREAATAAGYPGRVRDLEGSDTGIDAGLWTLLAEVLAVAEELGATLAPVPFVSSTVLCGQVLAGCGEAAAPFLERLAGGEIAAPALTGRRGAWVPDDVPCTSDGATVSGSAPIVAFGASASLLVVAARTAEGVDVFAVDAADAAVTPLPSLDFSRPSAAVSFDSAPAVRLTEGGSGAAVVDAGVDLALLAVGADQLGGTQACFDMTLEYIKVRRQFNREIGSFQAIKHRMADALMLVEMARSGLERMTWDEVENLSADASVVKAWGSDSYKDVAAETVQLHGGIGFTWEHDAHLYFRRARYDAAFLGDAPFHRERVATLLGW